MNKAENAAASSPYIVQLPKPYKYGNTEYAQIDLSAMEKMTVADMIKVQKNLLDAGEEATALVMETTTAFACAMASHATGESRAFFGAMPVNTIRAVQRAIVKALNSDTDSAADSPRVLKLAVPYTYMGAREDMQGMVFHEVDFADAAFISANDIAAAENAAARMGQIITGSKSRNYAYICCIASKASKLPEDFFTGLPIREAFNLLNVCNGDDFFG